MEIKIAKENMKQKWEEYVEDKPTIAWQSWGWYDVVKKHYSVRFFPLVAIDNSKICGILPLYLLKSLVGKPKLISVPFAVAGGIVSDNNDVEAGLLAKAVELYQLLDCSIITLKQYKTKIHGDLKVDENYYNRELDLTQDITNIWNNLTKRNKDNVENAGKYNLTLEHPSSNIKDFYDLMLRHHKHSGIPCTSKKWIEDLIRFKMYSIALLRREDSIVAGTMVKEHKKTVSYPFTCIADSSAMNNVFAYQLYWLLIEKFANAGKEIFHSGRIPITDVTNEYRLGWGGTKCNYYYQYYPNNAGRTEFSTKRGKKRELFTSAWKKLPIWMTRRLGPYIVKHFP